MNGEGEANLANAETRLRNAGVRAPGAVLALSV
jgi:hypothetical protein